ncbi:MAG: ATP-binding cassette domain-containing protein [Desulfobulbaceae bacterium]|nr:MAG: ATP-binding cassette domain-containing protein [Desulfobulbaceae bacterium]
MISGEEIHLAVSSLAKSFDGRGVILDDVSFSIKKGDAVALIGGNGSGKSTLLRCCLRLVEPDRGEISLLGMPVTSLRRSPLRALRSRVGLIFQRHNLVPRLTVLSNVIHGSMNSGWGFRRWRQGFAPAEIREQAIGCLEKVGLPHLANSRADQLSGGESQRVAIARALMQKPDFIMADEPVASLDPKVGREVMDLFVNLIKTENITFLFVSHDLEHALTYSNRLMAMKDGVLHLNGETKDYQTADLHEIYG